MTWSRLILAAALIAALAACTSHDVGAEAQVATGYGTASQVVAGTTCPSAVAAQLFRRAACACAGSTLGDLVIDGDVGIVGGLQSSGRLQVGGSLVVSGGGLEAGSTLDVGGDLEVGGSLGRPSSAVTVRGSARIGGDVAVASLAVGGTLTTPPGATVVPAPGSSATAAVAVEPPCRCAAQDVDFGALVARHQTENDNASAPLALAALSSVSGSAPPVELPGGIYYLDAIQGTGTVTVRAKGIAALIVGWGGLNLPQGALAVELDPGAQLDLFVAGSVNLPPTLRLGDPARPSALRVWLAQGGAIGVPAGALISANLYAPHADLAVDAPQELSGAVLVGKVVNSALLRIHYDPTIAGAGTGCVP